jgi:hypothetical protein
MMLARVVLTQVRISKLLQCVFSNHLLTAHSLILRLYGANNYCLLVRLPLLVKPLSKDKK